MRRRILPLTCALMCLVLLHSAAGQQPGQDKPVKLRILLPEEDADLEIDGKATKETGLKREILVPPPKKAAGSYTYTLTASWMPNNYTTVFRTRKVVVQAGKEVE